MANRDKKKGGEEMQSECVLREITQVIWADLHCNLCRHSTCVADLRRPDSKGSRNIRASIFFLLAIVLHKGWNRGSIRAEGKPAAWTVKDGHSEMG